MSHYNNLLNNLEALKLNRIREHLDSYLDLINEHKKDFTESLYELTELEVEYLKEKQIRNSLQFAGLPQQKTFDNFDFSFQPTLNKDKIMELKNLRFIEKHENILLVGSPGVGKTHLAAAIGGETAKNRYRTYFINCNDLIAHLKTAQSENRIGYKLNQYAKYRLLIIDEVGYLPFDHEGANLFFQLINKRYERNSTIITTNEPFGKWGELFGDNMIANAILDRLVHHSQIFNITGKSYRLKDKLNDRKEEQPSNKS